MNSKVTPIGSTSVLVFIPSITKEGKSIPKDLIDDAQLKVRECLTELFNGAYPPRHITGSYLHGEGTLKKKIIHEENILIEAVTEYEYLTNN